MEQKGDELSKSNEQLGLANEQLKLHDRMQKEFINVASHEMKTPTQARVRRSNKKERPPSQDLLSYRK